MQNANFSSKILDLIGRGDVERALEELKAEVDKMDLSESEVEHLNPRIVDIELLLAKKSVSLEDDLVYSSRASAKLISLMNEIVQPDTNAILGLIDLQNRIIQKQANEIARLKKSDTAESSDFHEKPSFHERRVRGVGAKEKIPIKYAKVTHSKQNDKYYVGFVAEDNEDMFMATQFPRNEALAIFNIINNPKQYIFGYDLFYTFLLDWNFKVTYVFIDRFVKGKYYCKYAVKKDGRLNEFNCAHVEGIILALMAKSALFVSADIYEKNFFSQQKFWASQKDEEE